MIIMAPATRREALGIEWAARAMDYSLPAQRVTRLQDRLIERYGKPERLRSDNGWSATTARVYQSSFARLVSK